MNTRNMVGAFLEHDNDILCIYRDKSKQLEPCKWAGVGGHMEHSEMNSPYAACIREINEETGIEEKNVLDLKMKYITINNKDNEVRIAFYFFGKLTNKIPLSETGEGILKWIPKSEVLSYNLSNNVKSILEHWLTHNEEKIYVCTINNEECTYKILPI